MPDDPLSSALPADSGPTSKPSDSDPPADDARPDADDPSNTTAAELSQTKAELQKLQKSLETQQNLIQAFAYSSARSQPDSSDDDPVDDLDDADLDDATKKVIAKIEARSEQRVKKLEESLVGRYSSARSQDLKRFARDERRRIEGKIARLNEADPDLKLSSTDLDRWIEDNGIQEEWLSADGAYDSVLKSILGEREIERRLAAANRARPLGSGGTRTAAAPDTPDYSDELAAIRSVTPDIDESDLPLLLKEETTAGEFIAHMTAKKRQA